MFNEVGDSLDADDTFLCESFDRRTFLCESFDRRIILSGRQLLWMRDLLEERHFRKVNEE
jgi:hypothetical protein